MGKRPGIAEGAVTADSIRAGTISTSTLGVPELEEPEAVQLPKALVEPARRIGNALAGLLALLAALVAIVLPLVDLVPAQYQDRFRVIVGIIGAATAAGTKFATELIRGKVTPAWKLRRVYEEWERSVHVDQEGDNRQPGPGDVVWNAGAGEPYEHPESLEPHPTDVLPPVRATLDPLFQQQTAPSDPTRIAGERVSWVAPGEEHPAPPTEG